ncbi:reverse transcriptase-like protein [Candidatus Saccharibacteria bacterium]|nr:reverse transcriptase-like protein [Candidatus Saccharibacteria bacterium]
MKQRVRVVGIAKTADGTLLLKRSQGRMEQPPEWELLTGKIRFGEQPEEAIARTAYEYLSVELAEVKLKDVVTFTSLADASGQSNLYIVFDIKISDGVKVRPIDRYTAYKYAKDNEMVSMRLTDSTISVLEITDQRTPLEGVKNVMNQAREAANGATVYVDGGSRGNPGPAATGLYVIGEDGKVLAQEGKFIGFATSRMAEYYAMRAGVKKALELGLKRVRFVGDNLMVINQLRGIYPVKNTDLLPIYDEIQKLLREFEAVTFVHVKRAQNAIADMEADEALEGHFSHKNKPEYDESEYADTDDYAAEPGDLEGMDSETETNML